MAQSGGTVASAIVGQHLAIYPPGEVTIGSSWKPDLSELGPAADEVSAVYRLKSRKGGVAVVEFELNADVEEGGGPMGIMVASSGSAEGRYRIDEATGCILEGRVEQKGSTELKLPGQKKTKVSGKSVDKVSLIEKG